MDFLIVAIITLSIAVVVLMSAVHSIKLNLADCINQKELERIAKHKQLGLIVERLRLYNATFPPVDSGLYSKVIDLYDCSELLPYTTPVEARTRHEMYWTRENFHDYELIVLWLEGVIECPKT